MDYPLEILAGTTVIRELWSVGSDIEMILMKAVHKIWMLDDLRRFLETKPCDGKVIETFRLYLIYSGYVFPTDLAMGQKKLGNYLQLMTQMVITNIYRAFPGVESGVPLGFVRSIQESKIPLKVGAPEIDPDARKFLSYLWDIKIKYRACNYINIGNETIASKMSEIFSLWHECRIKWTDPVTRSSNFGTYLRKIKDDRFDLITMWYGLQTSHDAVKLMQDITRIANPGAYLIIRNDEVSDTDYHRKLLYSDFMVNEILFSCRDYGQLNYYRGSCWTSEVIDAFITGYGWKLIYKSVNPDKYFNPLGTTYRIYHNI